MRSSSAAALRAIVAARSGRASPRPPESASSRKDPCGVSAGRSEKACSRSITSTEPSATFTGSFDPADAAMPTMSRRPPTTQIAIVSRLAAMAVRNCFIIIRTREESAIGVCSSYACRVEKAPEGYTEGPAASKHDGRVAIGACRCSGSVTASNRAVTPRCFPARRTPVHARLQGPTRRYPLSAAGRA